MDECIVYKLTFVQTDHTQIISDIENKLDKWIFELNRIDDNTFTIKLPIIQGRDVEDFEEDMNYLFDGVTVTRI